ncbi:MAG: DUF4249 family protein [Ignavibacteriales bacterium]|nr:DUF4249 family protein [Ignavibacteriales bacterium]
MRIFLYILLLSILLISCEENFSPKTEFKEKYVLYCLVNADATWIQIQAFAWIANIYDVEGIDPNKKTIKPNIRGAKLTLFKKNFQYPFYEYSEVHTSQYDTLKNYFITNISNPSPDRDISIKAALTNGVVLSGKTSIPMNLNLEFSYTFASGFTTNINKFHHGYSWIIDWSGSFGEHDEHLFFTKIFINYYKQVGTDKIYGSVEVPIKIIQKNGQDIPVYPTYTYTHSISFDYDAFDWAMKQIAGNDPNKADYNIINLILSIDEFDLNLSKFYSSVNGYLDQFSIRIDERTYSNINGGIGIFGSYTSTMIDFEINKAYVESFGYKRY